MKKFKEWFDSKSLIFPNKTYLFIIPALLMFTVFWVLPIFQLFRYSLTNYNGITSNFRFVGLSNYKFLLRQGTILNSSKNTLIYTIVLVLGNNILALGMAILLNIKIKAKGLFRTLAYLPALFSPIVVGFIWSYVYMPDSGLIASLLSAFGFGTINFNILGSYDLAIYGVAIVEIWKRFGTTMIIYLAGLQTIDNSLLEASRIDGCNEWQMVRFIKLPLISASITINIVLSVIYGLKAFHYIFVMTNGGPGTATNTLMYQVYNIAFSEQMMGKASALAVVAFLVIITITIIMLIFMNKREVEL